VRVCFGCPGVHAPAFSERRDASEDKIVAGRSGWNSRSFIWVVTRVSNFAIGID
jgi:hypothetical protein